MIVEPPSIGSTTDEKGNSKPVSKHALFSATEQAGPDSLSTRSLLPCGDDDTSASKLQRGAVILMAGSWKGLKSHKNWKSHRQPAENLKKDLTVKCILETLYYPPPLYKNQLLPDFSISADWLSGSCCLAHCNIRKVSTQ